MPSPKGEGNSDKHVGDRGRFELLRDRNLQIKRTGQRTAVEPGNYGRSGLDIRCGLRIGGRQGAEWGGSSPLRLRARPVSVCPSLRPAPSWHSRGTDIAVTG